MQAPSACRGSCDMRPTESRFKPAAYPHVVADAIEGQPDHVSSSHAGRGGRHNRQRVHQHGSGNEHRQSVVGNRWAGLSACCATADVGWSPLPAPPAHESYDSALCHE
eukprot:365483-Chlamydomonas_euryale.AAC.3